MNLIDVACAELDEARAIAAEYDLPIASTLAHHLDSCPRCSLLEGPPAGTAVRAELAALAGRPVWDEDVLATALKLASRTNPQYQLAVMALLAERAAEARPAEAWAGFARMLLNTEDAEAAIAAVDALAALVPAAGAAEGLHEALESESVHVRAAAARAIAADPTVAARREVAESLADALRDTEETDAEIRWHATAALGAAGPAAAAYQSALIAALAADPSWLVRRAAAFALGNAGLLNALGVREALSKASKEDKDEDVRAAAAEVLENVRQAAELMIAAVETPFAAGAATSVRLPLTPERKFQVIARLARTAREALDNLGRVTEPLTRVEGLQPSMLQTAGEREVFATYAGDPGEARGEIFVEEDVIFLLLEPPVIEAAAQADDVTRWWDIRFPEATGRDVDDGIVWRADRHPTGFRVQPRSFRRAWEGELGRLVNNLPETRDRARRLFASIEAELKESSQVS